MIYDFKHYVSPPSNLRVNATSLQADERLEETNFLCFERQRRKTHIENFKTSSLLFLTASVKHLKSNQASSQSTQFSKPVGSIFGLAG